MIDLESLAQRHLETLVVTMEEVLTIVKDHSKSTEDRLAAAKTIDSMSTTIIASDMADRHMDKDHKSKDKLVNQIDKLNRHIDRDHKED